jgi:flagellar basal body-associated protein FliL
MADQPQALPENAAAAPAKAKKSNLVLILLVGVATLLGGSGATYFLLARGKTTAAAASEKVEKKEPEATVHLESFTVNLNDQEESHFLRTTIELSLAHAPKGDPSGKEGGDSSFPMARTRDTIISVLTAAKANELLTPEGKATLKQSVLAALQQKVPEIEARDVYFTEFLVQR